MRRGLLIAFEGLDKAGKTTHCKLLYNNLKKNHKTQLIHFPVRNSATGVAIDSYLKSKIDLAPEASHLLFSANRWYFKESLSKSLEEGTIMILDRYILSGRAYSYTLGLEREWVDQSDSGLPLPDITFYLYNPNSKMPSEAERYEKQSFQAEVGRNYELLLSREPANKIRKVYTTAPIDSVHNIILGSLRPFLP